MTCLYTFTALIFVPSFQSLFEENIMFRWAIIFAVIALIASFLGFGGVAGLSANFAYILLAIAVILFIVAFVSRRM